jgi:hypothetical protein
MDRHPQTGRDLGGAAADRARTAGDRGEIQRDHTAIPLLLKHLDLKGALVTMDAMGTQTDIARAIRGGGGDYCLSLKKNWPAVYADVEQLFSDPPDDVAF